MILIGPIESALGMGEGGPFGNAFAGKWHKYTSRGSAVKNLRRELRGDRVKNKFLTRPPELAPPVFLISVDFYHGTQPDSVSRSIGYWWGLQGDNRPRTMIHGT